MSTKLTEIPPEIYADVALLFDFNQIHQELRPCSIGIGLGSHDPNVPIHTADLYHQGMFPLIVFTGANAPTTVDRFPRGEAVHFGEIARSRGVPADAILLETRARNTPENVTLTRELLHKRGIQASSAIVVCRPYQQRRAFATFRELWGELDVRFSSRPLSLHDYVDTIGDPGFVVDMIVGDTQRASESTEFVDEQAIPDGVISAFERLVHAGFTSRLRSTRSDTKPPRRERWTIPSRGIDH